MPPNPTPDTYTGTPGQTLLAGRASNPVVASVANAGTVAMLAKDWSASGFQLLTTIPDGLLLVNLPGHSGSAWDEARQSMWVYGSETHGSVQMDNAVYRWDAETGLCHRIYNRDPATGDHHIRADGLMFADAGETRPWAAHTFRNLWYDATTKELGVCMNTEEHAYATAWSPLPAGSGYLASRKLPIWYFNTVTGAWRYTLTDATNAFCAPELGAGLARVPGNGWWRVAGSNLTHLSEDVGTVTNFSIYGKLTNVLIQSVPHVVAGDKLVVIGGTGSNAHLGYVCDLANPAGGDHHMLPLSLFPALAGWSVENMWSVKMADGRILFGAYQGSPQQVGAFIFNWNGGSPTVTDTGHRLAASGGSSYYELRAEWSAKYNCAFLMSVRHGGNKMIGVRI